MPDVVEAVLVTCRSATGVTLTTAVPVLLDGTVSDTPGGRLTVAVLVSVPSADPATWTWKVTVTRPLGGRVMVPDRPVTVAANVLVVAPPETWLTTLVTVPRPAGSRSLKVALVAVLGPALVMTKLKVMEPPAETVGDPASLLMARSAAGVMTSVSVASVTDAGAKVTPDGGEIVTPLATEVCATAPHEKTSSSNAAAHQRSQSPWHLSQSTPRRRQARPAADGNAVI